MSNEIQRRAGHLDDDKRAEVLGKFAEDLAAAAGADLYGRQGATMQEMTNNKCVEHLQKEIGRRIEANHARIQEHEKSIVALQNEISDYMEHEKRLVEIQQRLK